MYVFYYHLHLRQIGDFMRLVLAIDGISSYALWFVDSSCVFVFLPSFS